MAYKCVNVWEGEWYRPEYVPVCDRCENEIRGEYAETRDWRLLCEDCVEAEDISEEDVTWRT